MSEGSPALGRVRGMVYARLEEMSFRSGVVVAAAVLIVAGMAIALAVTLAGHRAVPSRAADAGTAPLPAAPSPLSPSAVTSPTVSHLAGGTAPESRPASAADHAPGARAARVAAQAATSSPAGTAPERLTASRGIRTRAASPRGAFGWPWSPRPYGQRAPWRGGHWGWPGG